MLTAARKQRRGLYWALASAAGAALMVLPWKRANEVGDPAISVVLLLGVAALANTMLVIGQRIQPGSGGGEVGWRIGRREIAVAALLATFTLLGNWASARAIQDLSPAILNVLLRADILFVAIFAWLWLGERVEPRYWLGTAVAAFGLWILQGTGEMLGIAAWLSSGTGMAIAAAACFSGLAIVTRRFIHEIDPSAVNGLRLWLAVALWFPFNPAPQWAEIPAQQIVYASMAAISGPFLGRLALMISARHLEARVTTLATLTTPVLTLGLGFVLLADWPKNHELVGGAIMIAGVATPLLRKRREQAYRE